MFLTCCVGSFMLGILAGCIGTLVWSFAKLDKEHDTIITTIKDVKT